MCRGVLCFKQQRSKMKILSIENSRRRSTEIKTEISISFYSNVGCEGTVLNFIYLQIFFYFLQSTISKGGWIKKSCLWCSNLHKWRIIARSKTLELRILIYNQFSSQKLFLKYFRIYIKQQLHYTLIASNTLVKVYSAYIVRTESHFNLM